MDSLSPSNALTSQQAATSAAASSATASTTATSDRTLTSDFDTFLVMLTAQIQNQDPLNPIDSTDYAVQLATFSGVEQQVLTNELLEDMGATGSGFGTLSELAGWVGMDARVAGQAQLSGEGVELSFDMPRELQSANVEIRNDAGALIATLPVSQGASTATWNGQNSDGARVPDGSYSVALRGQNGDGAAVASDVYAYIRVTEARLGSEGGELRLADGRSVSPDAITALRTAP